MAINPKSTLLAIIGCTLSLLLSTACKRICSDHASYDLSGGTFRVVPDVDSIKVGDTLWLVCEMPNYLRYQNRPANDSSRYEITGASGLYTDIHLNALISQNSQSGAFDSFNILTPKIGSIKGNPYSPSNAATIVFSLQGDSYLFSTGFVANHRGVYALAVIDIYQAAKQCDKFSVSFNNNNIDPHLHFLQDIYYAGGMVDAIDQTHTYCFRVY